MENEKIKLQGKLNEKDEQLLKQKEEIDEISNEQKEELKNLNKKILSL
jgi:hypothetical protein